MKQPLRVITAARLIILLTVAGAARAQPPQFRIVGERVAPEIPAGARLLAADMDGDGDADLLSESGLSWFVNDGSAGFMAAPPGLVTAGPPIHRVLAAADLSGDGRADVITLSRIPPGGGFGGPAGRVITWYNTGNGFIPAYGPATTDLIPGWSFGFLVARRCTLGDVDGDGDLDAVVETENWPPFGFPGSPGTGPLLLWLNTGAGDFVDATAQMPVPTFSDWDGHLLRDLDGDGDLDLLLTSFATAGPTLLRNNGSGVFSAAPPPFGGPGAWGRVSAGDVNGDGLTDLVSVNWSVSPAPPALDLFLNLGGGSFAAPLTFVPGRTTGILLMDLDGDARDEAVLASDARLEVHRVGAAGIDPAVSQSLGVFGSVSLVEDLDADGDRDLLVDSPQGRRVLLNDGAGGLVHLAGSLTAPAAMQGALADLDRDGDLDLVCGDAWPTQSGLWIAWNHGLGVLAWEAPLNCAGGCTVAIRERSEIVPLDANGDGWIDLYVSDTGPSWTQPPGEGRLLINTGGSAWTDLPGVPGTVSRGPVRAGDLDSDGDPDLVFAGSAALGTPAGSLPWLAGGVSLNLGGGLYGAAAPFPAAHPAQDLALADLDGDGDLDVVIAAAVPPYDPGWPDRCAWLPNDGNGGFPVERTITRGRFGVETGDLDGDGDVDLLLDEGIWLNDGTGNFKPAGVLPVPSVVPWWYPPPAWILVDADDDADLDAVTAAGFLYRNAGGASFGPPEPFFAPESWWWSLAAGDLDEDGDQDLLSGNSRVLSNCHRQLALGRPPILGRTATIEVFAPPGSSWLLFGSATPDHFALPPYGTVCLAPASALLFAGGVLDATGRTETVFGVPADPALAGTRVWFQSLIGERLTNGVVVTLIP